MVVPQIKGKYLNSLQRLTKSVTACPLINRDGALGGQAGLVYWIIDNLDTVSEHEDVVDAAWRKEVRARVEAIKSGKVQMIAAEKMWKDILGNYVKTS
jgi:putative addiction module component (TIGR02574 family)